MIKIVRIYRGFKVFNIQKIMAYFKGYFSDQVKNKIEVNPLIGEDTDVDLNRVELLLYINFALKMLKLISTIFTLSYFTG
jgi:hypothetical protein